MLRTYVLATLVATSITHADGAPDTPIPTAQPVVLAPSPERQARKARVDAACAELLAHMRTAAPDQVRSAELRKEKRQLESDIAASVSGRNGLNRATRIKGIQLFERALSLLARGNSDELITLIEPFKQAVMDNATIIRDNLAKMAEISAAGSDQRDTLAELETAYQTASIPFGESYGTYMTLASLLESVAEGNGVGARSSIPVQHKDGAQSTLWLELTSPAAIQAASRVLKIIDPAIEMHWFPNSTAEVYSPSLEELNTLFKHNIYALIAKLRRDLTEQKKSQRWWLRSIHLLADTYMNATDKLPIPEKYRMWILRLTGIAYDQFMLERYLDKIQAVIEIARVHSKDGNIVLSTDPDTVNLQIQTLLEFDAQAIGDDLLTTFARIGYHTQVWTNLVQAVEAKAKESPKSEYASLHARMLAAQERKAKLGGLTYLYEPVITYKAIFASLQIAYLAGSEELVRHGWIGHFFHHMYHWFF